jgi:hypothetical protein
MKNTKIIEARLKDIISSIKEYEIDSYEYNCLLEKKELLEWVLEADA